MKDGTVRRRVRFWNKNVIIMGLVALVSLSLALIPFHQVIKSMFNPGTIGSSSPERLPKSYIFDANLTATYPKGSGTSLSKKEQAASGIVTLPIKSEAQPGNQLCWAAAASALARYYGESYSACQMAGLAGWWRNGVACLNLPGTMDDVSTSLKKANIPTTRYTRALTWNEVMQTIDSGRPILTRIKNNDSSEVVDSHIVIIRGYNRALRGVYFTDSTVGKSVSASPFNTPISLPAPYAGLVSKDGKANDGGMITFGVDGDGEWSIMKNPQWSETIVPNSVPKFLAR